MPQQSIKNIGQSRVSERLMLSTNFLLGCQERSSNALRFFIQCRSTAFWRQVCSKSFLGRGPFGGSTGWEERKA